MLEERSTDQVVLARDVRYWGPKPSIRRAVFKIFTSGRDAFASYLEGYVDAIGPSLGDDDATRERARTDPALGASSHDESATVFLVVNHRKPHLQDPRVRKALGMVIERQQMAAESFKYPTQPASSIHPPGIAGRNPALWPAENVDAARQLLAEAGFPDGQGFPPLSIPVSISATNEVVNVQARARAEYLRRRWQEALGVSAVLIEMESLAYLEWLNGDGWPTQVDVYLRVWQTDYEDPQNWFNQMWDSSADAAQARSGWKHDGYDMLVREAAGEPDPARREQLYGQAEQILADQYPMIPLYHYYYEVLAHSYVQGMQPNRVQGVLPLASMSVDQAAMPTRPLPVDPRSLVFSARDLGEHWRQFGQSAPSATSVAVAYGASFSNRVDFSSERLVASAVAVRPDAARAESNLESWRQTFEEGGFTFEALDGLGDGVAYRGGSPAGGQYSGTRLLFRVGRVAVQSDYYGDPLEEAEVIAVGLELARQLEQHIRAQLQRHLNPPPQPSGPGAPWAW